MVTTRLTGGLCNIMLQICATLAYSKKWNMPYAIPATTTHKRWKHYKFPGVHYEDVDTTGFFHYKEPSLFYNQRPYNITCQDIPYHENIILEGHFLSHKYFWDYKDEILSLFGFNPGKFGSYAALHTRRGDYLNMQEYLPCMSLDYYERAINWVIENTGINKFMVFGDDPIWNRENINTINFPQCKEIKYSIDRTELEDLELMASCKIQITANSTYSPFAHYLNRHEDKICISPEKWYGPAYGEVDKRDMYFPGTILL